LAIFWSSRFTFEKTASYSLIPEFRRFSASLTWLSLSVNIFVVGTFPHSPARLRGMRDRFCREYAGTSYSVLGPSSTYIPAGAGKSENRSE
jgi:hypothetical protein